jgi:LysR family glycine cleavage system transcriptional activator
MTRRKALPLNALRAFEATGRLGRMTAAADELAVTHGAVSRQVRQLEDFLGVELFEGQRNRPALTTAGETLLPALTSALDQIDAAVRTVIDEEEGILDVACYSTFAMRWLIPRLHRFHNTYPGIDVRLSTDDRQTNLARGRFDLAVTAIDETTKSDAPDVVLFPERLGVVLAPSLVPKKRPVRVQDVARLPKLATRTRPNAWTLWQKSIGAKLSPAKPAAEYEHYYFAIEAAASGLGACVVPLHLVTADLRNGRLIAPFGFIESGYRYVARQQRLPNKKSTKFCTWLQSEVSKDDKSDNYSPQY